MRIEEYPLHKAIQELNVEMVKKLLLNHECDINCYDVYGYTPLHTATAPIDLMAERLIKAYNIPKANTDVFSVMICKARSMVEDAQKKIINLLLEKPNIDVNKENSLGYTPLGLAIFLENEFFVRILLDDPRIDVNMCNKIGNDNLSALHLAVSNHLNDVLELLLGNSEINANFINKEEQTPIHFAILFKSYKVFRQLLDFPGTDLNKGGKNGWTLLHYVVNAGNGLENEDLYKIAQCLLDDSEIDINHKDSDGKTALYYAAEAGVLSLVQLFLCDPKIKVNEPNLNGETPLHVSAALNLGSITTLLLNHPKIDVNATTNMEQSTPIHYAAIHDSYEAMKILLEDSSIDVNSINIDGYTAIHAAAQCGSISALKLLSNNPSVKFNIKTNKRICPIQLATFSGHSDIVDILIEHSNVPDYGLHEAFYLRTGSHLLNMAEGKVFSVEQCGSFVVSFSDFAHFYCTATDDKRKNYRNVCFLINEISQNSSVERTPLYKHKEIFEIIKNDGIEFNQSDKGLLFAVPTLFDDDLRKEYKTKSGAIVDILQNTPELLKKMLSIHNDEWEQDIHEMLLEVHKQRLTGQMKSIQLIASHLYAKSFCLKSNDLKYVEFSGWGVGFQTSSGEITFLVKRAGLVDENFPDHETIDVSTKYKILQLESVVIYQNEFNDGWNSLLLSICSNDIQLDNRCLLLSSAILEWLINPVVKGELRSVEIINFSFTLLHSIPFYNFGELIDSVFAFDVYLKHKVLSKLPEDILNIVLYSSARMTPFYNPDSEKHKGWLKSTHDLFNDDQMKLFRDECHKHGVVLHEEDYTGNAESISE